MNEKKIEKTTKELEKHLEELIKVKMMRLVSEAIQSKRVTTKWGPILSFVENLQPGLLEKLQKVLKESLDKKAT